MRKPGNMCKSLELSIRYHKKLLFVLYFYELSEKSKIGGANEDTVEKHVQRNNVFYCCRRDNEVRL